MPIEMNSVHFAGKRFSLACVELFMVRRKFACFESWNNSRRICLCNGEVNMVLIVIGNVHLRACRLDL